MIADLLVDSYLIVGLGNPGSEYLGTRHNFGFIAVDYLLEKIDSAGPFTFVEEVQSEIAVGRLIGKPVCLLKPLTFMNRSGVAVQALLERQKDINPQQIIVVHDDLDLDLGRVKLKQGGGSGGHNGLKSLVEEIGSSDFLRLRLGIGGESRVNSNDTVSFVLNRFTANELKIVDNVKRRIHSGLIKFFDSGLMAAMNQLNCRTVPEKVGKE
jgi:PTH1 family peptidyl-tRNA hydrolase